MIWLSGGSNNLYLHIRSSESSLTHCFFLVWERSCLCWATIFFISSMSSSLHLSFTCLHFLSISACVLDTALDTACLFSSSISTRNCKDDHIAEFAAISPFFHQQGWLSWRKRGIFVSGHKREPDVSPKWKNVPHLVQSLFQDAFGFPLVLRFHHFFNVAEDLGVFVVAHVLAVALADRLRASVYHARSWWGRGGRRARLFGLGGDGHTLRLMWNSCWDLLTWADGFHLRLRFLIQTAGYSKGDVNSIYHISFNKRIAIQTSSLGSATWERRLFLALGSWLPFDCQ